MGRRACSSPGCGAHCEPSHLTNGMPNRHRPRTALLIAQRSSGRAQSVALSPPCRPDAGSVRSPRSLPARDGKCGFEVHSDKALRSRSARAPARSRPIRPLLRPVTRPTQLRGSRRHGRTPADPVALPLTHLRSGRSGDAPAEPVAPSIDQVGALAEPTALRSARLSSRRPGFGCPGCAYATAVGGRAGGTPRFTAGTGAASNEAGAWIVGRARCVPGAIGRLIEKQPEGSGQPPPARRRPLPRIAARERPPPPGRVSRETRSLIRSPRVSVAPRSSVTAASRSPAASPALVTPALGRPCLT